MLRLRTIVTSLFRLRCVWSRLALSACGNNDNGTADQRRQQAYAVADAVGDLLAK